MAHIAIMQGRLGVPEDGRFQSFPRHRWREEFAAARRAGLAGIEWIDDLYGVGFNPLWGDEQSSEMLALTEKHGVAVKSVCADYYMDVPIIREDVAGRADLVDRLSRLFERCRVLSITRVVLPFVDASRIDSEADEGVVVAFVERALPSAERSEVEIHLETDLAPAKFSKLLTRLDHPLVWANYDSGNSAGLGYDCGEEFAAYGPRIGSVHIKDRIRAGGTVPLGMGDANFPKLFQGLAELGYRRDFVLQVARSTPGDEISWASQNREYVEHLIEQTSAHS